jgi:hypothetical protein
MRVAHHDCLIPAAALIALGAWRMRRYAVV